MKLIKRAFYICFAMLMLLTAFPQFSAEAASSSYPFKDVNDYTNSKYKTAVTYLAGNGIINGVGNGYFEPNSYIRREDMVTMLWRVAGEPIVSVSSNFSDNRNTRAYYYDALRWAKDVGLANGYTDGTFGVGKKMTYQEAIQFIYNFATKVVKRYSTISNYVSTTTVNSRIASYADWAKTAARWAYKNRIATTAYQPNANCTRGNFAIMLYNYYKQYQRKFAYVGFAGSDVGQVGLHNEYTALFRDKFGVPKNNIITGKVDSETTFSKKIDSAFGNAKCIDKCYIYFHSHGSQSGLKLSSTNILSPSEFYQMIDAKEGMFTIMIEACYSGVFVNHFKRYGSDYSMHADIITAASSIQTSASMNLSDGNPAIASYCWLKALEENIPDSKNSYSFRETTSDFDLVLQGDGNGDGYVSMKELWLSTKKAINASRCNTANPTGEEQTCLYHSTSVNSVAFGRP